MTDTAQPRVSSRWGNWIRFPFDQRTLRETAYIAVGLPLALAWFVTFAVLLSFGIGLAITIVGLPLLGATLRVGMMALALEGRFAATVLRTDATGLPAKQKRIGVSAFRPAASIEAIRDRRAWNAMGRIMLLLPTSLAAFAVAFVTWTIGILGASASAWSWWLPRSMQPTLFSWHADSPRMTAAAAVLGVAALLVTRPAIHRLAGLRADIVRSEPLDEPTR
jgi:hypothetical protein